MTTRELLMKEYENKRNYLEIAVYTIPTFIAIAHFTTIYMAVATTAYFLMVTGFMFRSEKRVHFKLMTAAIFLDLSLVAVLEVKRHAIHTALSFTLTPLQQCHIAVSSVAAALYIPILILGALRLWGHRSKGVRSAHIILGISAFIFRSLGFILMFSMLGMHSGH
jgi:hypothetical protein